jgi:prolyl-tRNA synthetase
MAKLPSIENDFPRWYTDVVQQAKMADHGPVRGSMVIRPYGYAIWELMQKALDKMFKDTGHENVYFPMFIPESFLKKEAEHVEGFAPELAVVTHAGGKELEEPLVVRPTSETVIWNTYRDWIQSYRDLPLLYNQWANVVRWELRTRLFLRNTEFLWQEGHTAHATEVEAREHTLRMLEVYRRFAEGWMAAPVMTGVKTETERFAGGEDTYCIETMVRDRRTIQAGTSHFLGQNFAKAFDVTYQDEDGNLQLVWATSWGVSTRLVGALIMLHGDQKGLRLPPKLAPHQVVVVPIYKSDEDRARVLEAASSIATELGAVAIDGDPVRVKIDDRENVRPGFKFNEWELKGAPLRIELGPRDLDQGQVVIARRDTGEKSTVAREALAALVPSELDAIGQSLFDQAKAFRDENTHRIDSWDDFVSLFDGDGGGGYAYAHWDGTAETEALIKERTKATISCIPTDNPLDEGVCVQSGKPSKERVVFAKSY